MSSPSSQDLHPSAGARFAFVQVGDGAYEVVVYLPAGERLVARLVWNDEGKATLTELSPDPWPHSWPREEALKLARVLKKSPKQKMTRWRPDPSA